MNTREYTNHFQKLQMFNEPTKEEKEEYMNSIDWYDKLVKEPSLFETEKDFNYGSGGFDFG